MNSAEEHARVSLACQEIVARAVDPDDLTRSVPIRVRKAAFIPRKNGKYNAGLSVTGVRTNTLELLRQNLNAPQ
jgi:hypothetical protein